MITKTCCWDATQRQKRTGRPTVSRGTICPQKALRDQAKISTGVTSPKSAQHGKPSSAYQCGWQQDILLNISDLHARQAISPGAIPCLEDKLVPRCGGYSGAQKYKERDVTILPERCGPARTESNPLNLEPGQSSRSRIGKAPGTAPKCVDVDAHDGAASTMNDGCTGNANENCSISLQPPVGHPLGAWKI